MENKTSAKEGKAMEKTAGAKSAGAEELNERVDLMIPRDPSNPQEGDVSIIVNGTIFQIQRGVSVQVPRYVYQAYMDSEEQKAKAYDKAMKRVSKD